VTEHADMNSLIREAAGRGAVIASDVTTSPVERRRAGDVERGLWGGFPVDMTHEADESLRNMRDRLTGLSPFRSWSGRDPYAIIRGAHLHAIGGEQVLLCRVVFEPGTSAASHRHDETEQVMVIVDGEIEVTIGDARQRLGPGDVCVINRGVEHELRSESGGTFFSALAPVPLDHVPDFQRDLVLGPDGGARHVAR
jgi:quercetin dioxygenase-like cupin family protein